MKLAINPLFVIVATMSAATPAFSSNPNVLLIIADDMGVDASTCYNVGNTQAHMPNLERLCKTGMVFDNTYSAPVCSPTRASIITGKYGFRTGVGTAIPKKGGIGVSADEESLFDQLSKTSYSSNVIGKWHIAGSDDGLTHPKSLGVSNYYGLYTGGTGDYFKWTAVTNGKEETVDTYATTQFTNKAIEWIDKQNSPWFLWLAYNAPHTPFHLPPADLHTADDLTNDSAAIKANPLAYYNAMLEALDTEIGRLLESINDLDNTVVMFLGDNGTPAKTKKSVYGDRGMKGSFFEGGVHVPFIVNGPNVSSGRTSALVNTTDIYATVLDIAGGNNNAPDSLSFSTAFKGGETARTHVYVEHFAANPKDMRSKNTAGWAIRDSDFKLVAIDGKPNMLFDLSNDPLETTDLLAGDATANAVTKAAELKAAKPAL